MNKKFLKPVPLLVASLLASGVAGSLASQADAANSKNAEKNSQGELLLKHSDEGGTTPLGHRSHSSHSSHSSHTSHTSHTSHQSGFMGQ